MNLAEKKDRNKKIKQDFEKMRANGYSVGEACDVLQEIYGLQFDTIRNMVYKKDKTITT